MPDSDYQSAMRSFVSGQIGAELGLMSQDLEVGLEVARNLIRRGALAEAMQVYVGLVLCQPANQAFQIGLANCAIQLGEYHLALQSASVVIAQSPRDPRGYLLSGHACIGLGALAEAAVDLDEAISFGRAERNATIVEEARRLRQALPEAVETTASATG